LHQSYLNAGEICSGITVQSNLVLPSAGTYYPVLFLVEHSATCTDNNGFCYIDHIALINLQTGGPTVTVAVDERRCGRAAAPGVRSSQATPRSTHSTGRRNEPTSRSPPSRTIPTRSAARSPWPYGCKALPITARASTRATRRCSTNCLRAARRGNAQLAANSGCTAFDTGSIALTPVPAGTYYPVLLLEEYCGAASGSGYCVDDRQTFQNPITVSYPSGGGGVGSPGGGSGGCRPSSAASPPTSISPAALLIWPIGGVNNSTANTTGTIEVQVWFTTSPYTGGGFTGNKVASYRLPAGCTVGYNQLPPNSGCSGFDSGRITASYPSPGTYYAILAVDEYSSTNSACASNGGLCLASAMQLDQTVTVPQPIVVTPPIDTGGGSGGGGGSIDLFILGGLLILGCARAAARYARGGPTL